MADEIAVAEPEASTGESAAPQIEEAVSNPTESQLLGNATGPNDAYSLLEQAMQSQLGDENATEGASTPETPQIPGGFENALSISEFVREPQHVEQAIRAADEVWRVAAGQQPVTSLLEGMRSANPTGYEKIVRDLIPYIEQITGKKFGADPAAPPDPRDQRLSALEQQYRAEQQQRQQQAYQEQVNVARSIANDFLAQTLKGTFAEGNEAFVLAQCAGKAGIPEQQMVQQLLAGNTKPLETALKAVQKEETARLRKYNENLVKQYRTLKTSVPGVKGTGASKGDPNEEAYRPGETAIEYATRRFNAGA